MPASFEELQAEYADQWKRMAILPRCVSAVDDIARQLAANRSRYEAVTAKTGVPWHFIAALHSLESGGDFDTHLHNGDPLTARTRLVPAGRPLKGNPPFTWEESAIDALTMKGFDKIRNWSVERMAYCAEQYNGWGYRNRGVPSAYLWSFSNIYKGGKYVADGVWSSNAVSRQCGVMPILSKLGAPKSTTAAAGDLAGTIYATMKKRGYPVHEGKDVVNIVYIEGCNTDGTANGNRRNAFDDLRVLLQVDGKPRILGSWEATIETGVKFTEDPINDDGAARIAFGHQRAWQVGYHRGAYEALVQTGGAVSVYRDANADYKRDGDEMQTGWFGINQHHAYNAPKDNIGGHSAGCLVGRSVGGHEEFMKRVKSDKRYKANSKYVFDTTVMPYAWLEPAKAADKKPNAVVGTSLGVGSAVAVASGMAGAHPYWAVAIAAAAVIAVAAFFWWRAKK